MSIALVDAVQGLVEGTVPSLAATVAEPLGPRDAESNPLCGAFRAVPGGRVAIVGNGPLNEAHRKEVNTFDVVVR